MDHKTKGVLLALVIVAVLFMVGLGANVFTKKEGRSLSPSEQKAKAKKAAHGPIGLLNTLMTPFAPKLKPESLESSCPLHDGTIRLGRGFHQCTLTVPAFDDTDDQMRRATLRFRGTAALATVTFVPNRKPGKEGVKPSPVSWPRDFRRDFDLVVMSPGGRLVIDCLGCRFNPHMYLEVSFQ